MTGTVAEWYLERHLAYLHVGPSCPRAISSQLATHSSLLASVISVGDRTSQWLEGMQLHHLHLKHLLPLNL